MERSAGWLAVGLIVLAACGPATPAHRGEARAANGRTITNDDQLVELIAGDPAYRITAARGQTSPTWDLWTSVGDGPPSWTAALPALGWAEPVRSNGATFLVGPKCDDAGCTIASTSVAVELGPDPTVTELPVGGPVVLERGVTAQQIEGSGPDLVIWGTSATPGPELVQVSLPDRWRTRSNQFVGMGATTWCRSGDRTYVAIDPAVADEPVEVGTQKESNWEVHELTGATATKAGSINATVGDTVLCVGGTFVVRSFDDEIVGRWAPDSGFTTAADRIAPINAQIRWLDHGAIWVDDGGSLWMWNGSLHEVGSMHLSPEALHAHAESQSKPLGSSPSIMGLRGDIYGDLAIACAQETPQGAYDRCAQSAA